jgi:hypothetical protein
VAAGELEGGGEVGSAGFFSDLMMTRMMMMRPLTRSTMMRVGSQIPCHISIPPPAATQVVSRDVIWLKSQIWVIFADTARTRSGAWNARAANARLLDV